MVHHHAPTIPDDRMRVAVARIEIGIGQRLTVLPARTVDAEAVERVSNECGVIRFLDR